MTTTTFFSGTSDGNLRAQDNTYATMVAGAGFTVNTTSTTHNVGQDFNTPSYIAWQDFFEFDTSSIPDADTIDSVTFSLYGAVQDASVTDFTVEARLYDWGGTLESADWRTPAQFGALTLLASYATSGGWNLSGYNDFTSDGAFVSNVNKTGFTRMVVASSLFRTSTAPTGDEFVGLFLADQTGTTNDPKLVVNHSGAGIVTIRRTLLGVGV